ncbi:MAG TPA: tetratricopeptide repeat protein, partial [Kofleriaceae bacterium]
MTPPTPPPNSGDPSDPLGEDLLDELDQWDKMFDQLHTAEADVTQVRSLLAVEEAAAAETAAARSQQDTQPPPSGPVIPVAPPDEEAPFAVRGGEVELEGEPRALGALLGSSGRKPGGEEPDEELYTSAIRPMPQPGGAAAGKPAARTSPAIIRRTQPLTPMTTSSNRGLRGGGMFPNEVTRPGEPVPGFNDITAETRIDDFAKDERTQAIEEAVVGRLAESAEALFRDAPPDAGAVSLDVDADDFYDDIEVAAQASVAARTPMDEAVPLGRLPTSESTSRRTTQNIVRRERRSGDTAPSSFGARRLSGMQDVVSEPVGRVSVPLPPELPDTTEVIETPPGAPEGIDEEAEPITGVRETALPAPTVNEEIEGSFAGLIDQSAPRSVVPRPASDADGVDVDLGPEAAIPPARRPVAPQRIVSTAEEDREIDAAFLTASALSGGTMPVAQLVADVDVAPDLPPSRFALSEPAIDFAAIQVADVDPSQEDRTEELARDLLLYERELGLMDDPQPTARLRMEAGRLAERLGDLDRARAHYDGALQLDPRLRPPLRALRRVERALGNFGEAIRHLDAEIELASDMERRALASYRADLLMAVGEQDLARVAVGGLLDDAPADVRSLLANLELAWIDGRHLEAEASLDRLAQAVADEALVGAMHRTRAMVLAASAGDGESALRAALQIDGRDRLAWFGLAHRATAAGDQGAAAAAISGLVDELAPVTPALAGAFEWRRAEMLAHGESPEEVVGPALERAASLLPDDPTLIETRARLLAERGDMVPAAEELFRLASSAPDATRSAWAFRQAARLYASAGDAGGEQAALRNALARDPADPASAAELATALEDAGDEEGLVDLEKQQIAGDAGAVLARIHLAQRLARLERSDDAIAILASGRGDGRSSSAALDSDLASAYRQAGRWRELADLTARQKAEKAGHLDPWVLERRAAMALEAVFERAPKASPATAAAVPVAAEWDDRSSGGMLEGVPVQVDAVPEPVFSPPSARVQSDDGAPSGPWVAREPLSLGSAPVSAREPARDAALAAWRRVLETTPDSSEARSAVLRLVDAVEDLQERLAALAALQKVAGQSPFAVDLALRRAEIFIAEFDRDAAEEVLRAGAALDPDNPRCHLVLLRLYAEDLRWEDAAELLAERATSAGDGDEAISLRYRAAAILLDKTEEVSRAVDLLTPVVNARPDFVIAADLLRAAQRRLGEAPPPAATASEPASALAPRAAGQDDGFARLVREAEMVEIQNGDAGREADLYRRAMELRPDDPLARDGFARAAARAGETAPLAELALADLRRAEAMGDGAAKATAYEELARIDAELRGDLATGVMAWESAVESDPARVSALRNLERAYLAGGRPRELQLVYERTLNVLEGTREKVALLGEMARLSERAERPRDEALGYQRDILALDPMQRMALFRLEAGARQEGPSRALADLETKVARFFAGGTAGDARAEAAFLTRAGETLLAIGAREEAIASFRSAAAALPGYAPALAGWREGALAGEMWTDVADAAEKEAESAVESGERARLYHLAGVTLMDRAMAGERAIGALRRVLDIDPAHRDAFQRLKLLYEEMGRDLELVELYRQRLEVDRDPAVQIRLHQGLAAMYRNFFDDREAAQNHLKAALGIDPNNRRVIADLSDIAWELGDWAQAAEMLITRAKLESRPEVLRHIFFRLGTIYADRIPDARYAMMSFQKVLSYDPHDTGALERVADLAFGAGDTRLALGACEQLIKQTHSDQAKVPYLHRVARIYAEGLKDRQRAERALKIALDFDPMSDLALSTLVDFYRDAGDATSARVHLDRVASAMRHRVLIDAAELEPYRVLARALEAREQAGVPGSLATAAAAAEIAVLLGSPDPRDAEVAANALRARPALGPLG